MRSSRVADIDVKGFNWRILYYVFPYLIQYKQRIMLAIGFMVGAKLASVSIPIILKYLVDGLAVDDNSSTVLVALPLSLLIAYGSCRLASVVFGEIRDLLFGRVTEKTIRSISLKVFQHLHCLDLDFHLERKTGGLARDIERGTSGFNFLMRFMVFNIVPTLIEIALIIVILLYNFEIGFAIIVLLSVIFYVSFSAYATEWRIQFIREANQADSRTNHQAIDSLLNYETTKYFGNEGYEAHRYDQSLEQWELAKRKNRLSLFALNTGQAVIIAVAITAMLSLAAHNVMAGTISLGDFVLINAYIMQLFLPLNFLGFVYREIKGALANIEQLFQLLTIKPKIHQDPAAPALCLTAGKIEYQRVSFSYSQSRSILSEISFVIEPGERLAIVGPSGHGKSTLIKLLFRFYDPDGGRVLIDGQDIKQVTLSSLRQALGVVPQDTVLFNDTLFHNVQYANPQATESEVFNAISLAHLDEFIARLPEGVNTRVGERGLKLSGGEKQRIAIARTLLKNPPILIFDEATSSLDSHSEQAILSAFKALSKNTTSIVIAHRLSTVVDADKIVLIKNGSILEHGSHAELLQMNGEYQRLWQAQQGTDD